MPNVLSVYDPIFYAQEALQELEKALGMAGRVYRGYDKQPQERGSIISIRRPSTFLAQDAPSSAQDVKASEVQIALNYWREVKFGLTDKELTYTGERIVSEHVRPAAYALADDIDQKLTALAARVPYFVNTTSPAAVNDITAARRVLFDNKVPMDPTALHFMVNGQVESELLNLAAFTQHQGAGDQGVDAQRRGYLGQRFGFEFFANQNVITLTGGTAADAIGAANAASTPAGATSIVVKSVTTAAAFKAGDVVKITGHAQQYVLTANATADAGIVTLPIEPGLEATVVEDQVIEVLTAASSPAAMSQNLAFHRNFAALAMAPLSEMGNELGARMATVVDPVSGLALRSRIFYEGNNSKVFVALDVLYGVQVLNHRMAVRVRD